MSATADNYFLWERTLAARLEEIDVDVRRLQGVCESIAADAPVARGGPASARIKASIERLERERSACVIYMRRVALAVAQLEPIQREILRMRYDQGLSLGRIALQLHYSENACWRIERMAALAVNTALRAMEAERPSGCVAVATGTAAGAGPKGPTAPAMPAWADRAENCWHSLIWLWAIAPERIVDLAGQLAAATTDADADRCLTAMEWYVRVWEPIDARISRMRQPWVRRMLDLRYRHGMECADVGRLLGIHQKVVTNRSIWVMDELRRRADAEMYALCEWRYLLSRRWYRHVGRSIKGFDEAWRLEDLAPSRVAQARRNGNRPRAVDWREVDKLMRDEGHRIDLDQLIARWD